MLQRGKEHWRSEVRLRLEKIRSWHDQPDIDPQAMDVNVVNPALIKVYRMWERILLLLGS